VQVFPLLDPVVVDYRGVHLLAHVHHDDPGIGGRRAGLLVDAPGESAMSLSVFYHEQFTSADRRRRRVVGVVA
jgi:hypothetical protein